MLQVLAVLVAREGSSLLDLTEEGDCAVVFKAVLVNDLVTHFIKAIVVVDFVNCHCYFLLYSWDLSLSVYIIPHARAFVKGF